MNILLITEQREGKWNKTSFETLAAAQQIAAETQGRLAGAVIGQGVKPLADELAGKKLGDVLLVEHELLAAYTPDGYTIALGQVIAQVKPDLVLAHALHQAPRLRTIDVPVAVYLPGPPHRRYVADLRAAEGLISDGWAAKHLPAQIGRPHIGSVV